MKPLISVITPVYNRADCIIRCLQSVSSQKGDMAFEHVVVDDGSSDNSFALVEEYASTHSCVKAIRLERNKGTNAARNAAVNAAGGEFILLLDSDDALAEGSLQFVADIIKSNPQYREFLFTTDDQADYITSKGLGPDDSCEVTFHQWILDKFEGDYAHVVSRDVMLKYPFEEKLRTHEGIYFDLFFREVGAALFVNHIVLLRDRSRDDHVSLALISDNKETIMRAVEGYRIMMRLLYRDYIATAEGREFIKKEILQYHRKSVLLGRNDDALFCEDRLAELGSTPSLLFKTLRRLRLGPQFFAVGKHYIRLKYKLWGRVK